MNKEQFEQITEWQDQTFPESTSLSRAKHLQKEVQELIDDLESDHIGAELEFADCFILLFGAAKKYGFNYEWICEIIQRKFEVNQSRKWGIPDADGVVNHLKN